MNNTVSNAGDMPQEKPSNYLVLAIVTTFFCCQITGVVSIIYAARVNAKWAGGNYEGALEDSKNAKLWGIISLILGVIIGTSVLAFYGAIFASLMANGGDFNGY